MWGIIAIWEMALEGVKKASALLKSGKKASLFVMEAIKNVEDNPVYTSVDYGGFPNENGEVQLDAAFMNENNLSLRVIAGIKTYNKL